jgi:iron complex outermembrane recepter protein
MPVISRFTADYRASTIYPAAGDNIRHRWWIRGYLAGIVVVLLCSFASSRVAAAADTEQLLDMTLESLMDIEVTTVAKRPQTLAETAASVYVVSSEDIRRSGATTIPDALRLVPGMEIAHIDGNKVAMAMRGFNSGASSNKLLVLIDGRVVYTALLSGVFWEHHDVLMADIDRIEVIRGPGGTMWGANAVNGVVNIITRNAADTQGGLVEGIVGTDPVGNHGAIRYGGRLGADAHYRVYGKYLDRGEFRFADGSRAGDDRQVAQGGARIDWRPSVRDHVTLQGDFHDGSFRQNAFDAPVTIDFFSGNLLSGTSRDRGDLRGGNVIGRWHHDLEAGGETTLQFYYDRFERRDRLAPHTTDTWDLDFQHNFAAGDRLNMLWGLGYRRVDYNFDNQPTIELTPSSRGLNTFSGFIQGDYDLTDRLRLTLGSKFEHNDFTGFEFQPNVRMLWQPHQRHTLWGAVSRAVRVPSVFEAFARTDMFMFEEIPPFLPPTTFSFFGNRNLKAEELLAFEAGYRSQLRPDLSFDLSLFYKEYDNLINFEPDPDFELFVDDQARFSADNRLKGESYGFEITAEWQAHERWRLVAGYSFTKLSLRADSTSLDEFTAPGIERSSPQQQVQLRSYLDLPHNLEFDVSLFWNDQLPGSEALFLQQVDDYVRLDLRLGWRPIPALSLDLFAQNVLQDHHPEFRDGSVVRSEMPRAIFGRARLTW